MNPLFIWDLPEDPDGNVAHIAEHGVTQDEYESVFDDPNVSLDISRSSGNPIAFGTTHTGRFLAAVYEYVCDDPWTIYPITAYEVTEEATPMNRRIYRDQKLPPEEVARLRAIRDKYQREKPTPADIVAAGGTLAPLDRAQALFAIGSMLRRERERQGLTLREVAERAGMGEPALSKVETGANPNPTVDTLFRIADALGQVATFELRGAAG